MVTTDDADYDFSATLDDRWFELPVQPGADVSRWASAAVEEALRLRGLDETRYRRVVWEQLYAAEVDLLTIPAGLDSMLVAAYLLVPSATDVVPVVAVSLQALWVGASPMDEVVEGAVVPADERHGAPEVDELATSLGACVRVRQLLRGAPGSDGTARASRALVYVWDIPEPELVLVAAATFGSPSDAADYEDAVEELVSSVTMRLVA